MAIRWKYTDRRNLQKVIASYNGRITRELNKQPELAMFAPRQVTYEEVRAKISTRADYNRIVNSLKRIHQKGAFELQDSGAGELRTKYEIKEARILTNTTNKRIKNYFDKVSGENTTRREIAETNFFIRPFNFKQMEQGNFDRFVESMEKQLRRIQNPKVIDENYYWEYLGALTKELGIGVSDALYDFVKGLPPEAVSQARFENAFLTVTAIYNPAEVGERLEMITEQWEDWWSRNKQRFS
ncbi:hypothetical protein QEJ67_gp08 [Clostridium phage CI55P1]|jgi:hypothetical protein|uniref:hypothetical protein n=1 Tax=Clostridium phage CI55P1 TaxID=2968677 RepID=UPI002434318C|nr:hypothetical protein QEJ67_gp08 [Clostridium phage CI55P1]WAX11726.1 hypothetical protein CI55P1_00008 [Clostridium phage CI55P1]WAX11743.1 hypothetical protein CI55P2_00007 [Clostridium phage CI55P2]